MIASRTTKILPTERSASSLHTDVDRPNRRRLMAASTAAAGAATSPESFALLVIDPQVDFHTGGSLAVAGADMDAERIGAFIRANLDRITSIYVTLDTHQRMHISHGLFWRGQDGEPPPAFTCITHADVVTGKWTPVNAEHKDYAQSYLRRLEEEEDGGGHFQHTIWPEHCLIGSTGHSVVPPVLEALHAWAAHTHRPIQYHWKGVNPLAEMYSVFRAEVPVPGDPSTEMNVALVEQLKAEPRVRICGQALSHCVNFSTRDLISVWPPDRLGDLSLLRTMTSPVAGFEEQADEFVRYLRAMGVGVEEELG